MTQAQQKNDLMTAAAVVEAFADAALSGRPDLKALALRLREHANGREAEDRGAALQRALCGCNR